MDTTGTKIDVPVAYNATCHSTIINLHISFRPNNGGRPVLRSAPPDYVSKTEAKRLIETVSKLVVVTVDISVSD